MKPECIACGLTLPFSVTTCPACGEAQSPDAAKSDDARCSDHPDVIATKTCARCGRFMCVTCTDHDSTSGTCKTCHEPLERELAASFAKLNVKLGIVTVVQGLLMPALAFFVHDMQLFGLCVAFGLFAVGFGLLSIATRTQWIVSVIAAGVLGLVAFWALGTSLLFALGIANTALMAKWILATGPIEREQWRLKKR